MKLRKLWHSVRGYEGLYQVSNFGEIRSLSRWKHLPNGQYTVSKEKLLSPGQIGKDGYKFVYLTVDGRSKRFYVHRIVAEAFLPNPNRLPFVNHLNGIKFDNRPENLEWCSYKYNSNYGTLPKRISERMTANHPNSKVVYQYDLDGNFIERTDVRHKGVHSLSLYLSFYFGGAFLGE